LDTNKLQALGIALKTSTAIERAYDELKVLAMLPVNGMKLMVLDLDSLPTKPFPFKEVFIRWALTVQESRILFGEDPIFPYELVKRCPLWRITPMPIKTLKLTKEGLFNKPKTPVIKIGQQQPFSSINKAK